MAKLGVLALLFPKFEEIETWVPIDLLRRAQISVTLASGSIHNKEIGAHGLRCSIDCGLKDCNSESFDALLLPGGPGVFELQNDPQVLDCIRRFASQKKWIAAICAAPLLLKQAECLPKHFTAHACVEKELPGCDTQHPVVVDDNIITSRGPGTAFPFAFELIQRLTSEDFVVELKKSIHYE